MEIEEYQREYQSTLSPKYERICVHVYNKDHQEKNDKQ